MKHLLFFLLVGVLVISALALGQVPNKISYQGLLTTSSGTPVQDGSYNLKFEIYNQPISGTLKHAETISGVSIQKGTFSVILRPPSSIFTDSLYVEVTALSGPGISSPLTFSPRSELTSAPYSLGLSLPFTESVSSSVPALSISNSGTAEAAKFSINNSSSTSPAVFAVTNASREAIFGMTNGSWPAGQFQVNNPSSGAAALVGFTNGSGAGVYGWTDGTGYAGWFRINNPSSNAPALFVQTNGNKEAVYGITSGPYCAGQFIINNPASNNAALVGYTNGNAPGVYGWTTGLGEAGTFRIANPANTVPALHALTNGTGPVAIFEGGNVGIGTTTPGSILTVSGGRGQFMGNSEPFSGKGLEIGYNGISDFGFVNSFDRGGGGWKPLDMAGNYVKITTGSSGTERVRVDADGNIGIGTTIPLHKLHVRGGDNIMQVGDYLEIYGNMPEFGAKIRGTSGLLLEEANSAYPFTIRSFREAAHGDAINIQTRHAGGSFVDRMTFSGFETPGKIALLNSNVGIGTSNPKAKLDVTGGVIRALATPSPSADTGTGLEIFFDSNGPIGRIVALDRITSIYYPIILGASEYRFQTNTVENMVLDSNGKLGIGVTNPSNILTIKQSSATDPIADSWTTYSSRRWKTNIKPIENALDKVQQLQGVSYDRKADSKHDIGLIAEEVGKVIPEVVAYEENGVDAKSVDYARLVALLIEAMKEQQKEIEYLKTVVKPLVPVK